jgi:4-amino-4-deoxy-L-arabinose transferase-like glycosyltransferase
MVSEGHYRLGFHAVRNALDYVVWLYVGTRNLLSYAAIVAALSLILVGGTRHARFAIGWIFVALLPFVFFTWGNTSRYLYLPGMGFAILLAEGIAWLDRLMARWPGTRWRLVVTNLVVAAVAVRFAVFASKTVRAFANATQPYRAYAAEIRASHPTLPDGAVITIEPAVDEKLKQRYLEGLVQWEYRNPTLHVRVRGE